MVLLVKEQKDQRNSRKNMPAITHTHTYTPNTFTHTTHTHTKAIIQGKDETEIWSRRKKENERKGGTL